MTRWTLVLLFLTGAAFGGKLRLKDLFDPAYPGFPLQRYTKKDWKELKPEQKLKARGVDPGEWIEPPPEILKGLKPPDEKEEEQEPPGFRFEDRLKRKQQAYDELVGNPAPSTFAGLVKQLKRMDKAGDKYDKAIAEEVERYNKLRDAVAQAMNNQIKRHLERTGKYPDGSQILISRSLQINFRQAERLVIRLLSIRQSERQFQAWVVGKIAALLNEYAEPERKAPLQALASGLKDRDWRQRSRCAEILARSGAERALEVLYGAIESEADPLVLAQFLRFAALKPTPRFEELLKARAADPAWPVRAAVAREVSQLKRKESVDLLIDRLGKEEGRVIDDVHTALVRLTGKQIGPDAELWRNWWKAARATWTPPTKTLEEQKQEAAEKGGVVYFYGIQTHSKRIVFCIDISGSMLFRLDGGQEGGGKKEPRIDTARRELLKAIEGLPEDATFAIVAYNAAVQEWKKGMVKATKKNKASARLFVERLDPVGGTNIFDALARSLEIAGRPPKGKGKTPEGDTIFFLTDGRPSVGQITDPDQILNEITARNKLYRVVIHAVGVAKEQNAAFLFNLAKRNGGTYVGHK